MNTLKKMLTSLLASVMLVGCASEDIVESTAAAPNGKGTVHFRLGGSAAPRTTRAGETILSEENERHIDNLFAMVWNINGEYLGLVDAVPSGAPGEYEMAIEKDGNYRAVFFANLDDASRQTLAGFDPEVGKNSNFTAITNAMYTTKIAPSLPDEPGKSCMMKTSDFVNFSSSIYKPTDIGQINMVRGMARFDFVNLANNITIKKITFNNRTIRTCGWLNSDKFNFNVEDDWYEDKVYPDLEIKGNADPEKAGKFQHQIYSFTNYPNSEKAKLSYFTIEYEEVENGVAVTRKHTVEMNDPNSNGNVPLATRQNTLYTITLRKAHNLKFDLTVNDWNADNDDFQSGAIKISDLDIDTDEQNRLNSQLMVNMFTDYNVKSLNLSTKQAELMDHLSMNFKDYSTASDGSWFSYNQIKTAGLTAKDAVITDKNNPNIKYRIPTAGEMALLFPFNQANILQDAPANKEEYNGGTIKGYSMTIGINGIRSPETLTMIGNAMRWLETLPFENDQDGCVPNASTVVNEDNGLISELNWTIGRKDPIYIYKDNDANLINMEEQYNTTLIPIYTIRFKNTRQYSAYKYEFISENGDRTKMYLSVKIKAIPENLDVLVQDIRDNDEYWSKDYIEYKFPMIGWVNNADGSNVSTTYAHVLTTSQSKALKSGITGIYGGASAQYLRCNTISSNSNYRLPLRLVKVEE